MLDDSPEICFVPHSPVKQRHSIGHSLCPLVGQSVGLSVCHAVKKTFRKAINLRYCPCQPIRDCCCCVYGLVISSGPLFVGVIVSKAHLATAWFWFSIAILQTTISHSGYHFPLLPSPEAHDFHHLKFNQNFGKLHIKN